MWCVLSARFNDLDREASLLLYDQQCGGLPPDANRALNVMAGGWYHQPGTVGDKEMKAASVWLAEIFNGLGRERWCHSEQAAIRE